MKDIPKHILVTMIVMVVVGLLGGGAWFWTSQQLQQKLEEKSSLEGEIQTIEKKGIFPSAKNKKILDDYKAKLLELDETLQPEIKNRMDLFSTIRTVDAATGSIKGLDPDSWKKIFGDKRQALRQLAKEKKLNIPDEYNFGFKSYVLAAPRAENTGDLGVQLLAIEEIARVAANADLDSLLSIKRTMVEDSRSTASASVAVTGNDEAINAKVLSGPEGLYRVFPFEITIKAGPEGIIKFLNGLGSSKFMLVARFVYLENEKSTLQKRSEITAVPATAPEIKKTLIAVVGQEKVTARIRLDLVDFLPPAPEPKNSKVKN